MNDALAHRLGYAGLLPLVVGALLVWLVWPEAHPYATAALAGYAAVIVSFLGGIHWGVAFARPDAHTSWWLWGVTPSLVAWIGVLMPPSSGLVILGVMFAVCYAVDRRLYPLYGLSRWLTLRFRLSALATLSCFIGAAGT